MRKLSTILAGGIAGVSLLILPLSASQSTQASAGSAVNMTSASGFWSSAAHVVTSSDHVQIINRLPSSWDVRGAVSFVDRYTASKMVFVSRCTSKFKCIYLKTGHLSGNRIARSDNSHTITVDVWRASKTGQFNSTTRRWLIAHEFGHQYGLGHSTSCHNTMYPYRRCGSKIPPLYFTASQRAVLRRG